MQIHHLQVTPDTPSFHCQHLIHHCLCVSRPQLLSGPSTSLQLTFILLIQPFRPALSSYMPGLRQVCPKSPLSISPSAPSSWNDPALYKQDSDRVSPQISHPSVACDCSWADAHILCYSWSASLCRIWLLPISHCSSFHSLSYEMVVWHCWLTAHAFEQAPGVGEGQGGLARCSPRGRKESDTTGRLNWTDHLPGSLQLQEGALLLPWALPMSVTSSHPAFLSSPRDPAIRFKRSPGGTLPVPHPSQAPCSALAFSCALLSHITATPPLTDGDKTGDKQLNPNLKLFNIWAVQCLRYFGWGRRWVVAAENWIKFTYLQIDSFRFMNFKCIPFYTVFYNYCGLDYKLPFEIFISSTQATKGDRFLHYLQQCQVFLHHQIVKENTQNICFPLFPA